MHSACDWRPPLRPPTALPRSIRVLLLVAVALQLAWHVLAPAPQPAPRALPPVPAEAIAALAATGDRISVAAGLLLWLPAQIDRPGARQSFHALDYGRLRDWLATVQAIDPDGTHALTLAVRVYAQVDDPERQRTLLDWVHDAVREHPAERWPWLAEAALLARHRLGDDGRALAYARTLYQRTAPGQAPVWVRALPARLLAERGQYRAAADHLEALLASDGSADPRERAWLERRLEALAQRADRP